MKTWVRKTLSVGVLAAGALLFAPAAAQADPTQNSTGNVGILNGTQVMAPIAIPLNVVGNAIGVGGEAHAAGAGANWLTENGGGATQNSTDNVGIGNGTQVYLPVDVPVNVVGNAISVIGVANAAGAGMNGTHTESARVETGNGGPTQNSTDNVGVLNGTQILAPVNIPINLCGNAISVIGDVAAQAICTNARHTESGGGATQNSTDNVGVLNGTQVMAPISIPLNVAGNAIGVAGEASGAAAASNESGNGGVGDQNSVGNVGVGNGTQIGAPVEVPVNVCGNGVSVGGAVNAVGACTNGGPGDGDDNGGNNGEYPDPDDVDGNTGGADNYDQGTPRSHPKAAATEASAVDSLTQSLTNAGGLNVGGLDVLKTLR